MVPKADLESNEIPVSYVPFRNANILSAAVSWAETNNANAIYIGAGSGTDSSYNGGISIGYYNTVIDNCIFDDNLCIWSL